MERQAAASGVTASDKTADAQADGRAVSSTVCSSAASGESGRELRTSSADAVPEGVLGRYGFHAGESPTKSSSAIGEMGRSGEPQPSSGLAADMLGWEM